MIFLNLSFKIILIIILACLSVIDLRARRVPAEIILSGACFYYMYIFMVWNRQGYAAAREMFIEGVIGAVVLFVLAFAASIITGALVKGNALGGGDIRLFSLIGLCLGLDKGLKTVLLTCAAASVFILLKNLTKDLSLTLRMTGEKNQHCAGTDCKIKKSGHSARNFYSLSARQFPLVPCISIAAFIVIFI